MDTTNSDTREKEGDHVVDDELQRLREENSSLNRRLLGVNELARLLQEKTEITNSLQEKNKRLEIAVVRLENRCSNFEKKMKASAAQYSSLPSNPTAASGSSKALPNSPFIPGPSRQILESLMKDNHELKKTINNLLKGGPAAYKEAVKMNQLEEVIDQKNEKIDLLQKQIENLTAPHDEEGSKVTVDPGLLKRQLLKMEQAMKVKDRFCTLLSDRVSQLESEVNSNKDTIDFEEETDHDISSKSKGEIIPRGAPETLNDAEKKSHKVIEELQSQVEKERSEKKDMLSKAEDSSRKVTNLESEIVSLTRKVDSLSTYNTTLVTEKMDLSGDIMRLNEKLQQEQSEVKKLKDENAELQNKNNEMYDEIDVLNNRVMEANFRLGEMQHKRTSSPWTGRPTHMTSGPGTGMKAYNPYVNKGQEVAVDGPGSKVRSSPEPQHCGTGSIPYMHRQEVLSRGVGGTESTNAETTIPMTSTTSTVTPSNAGARSLDLHSIQQQQQQQQQLHQQQQQQQQQQSLPPRTAQTPGYASYSSHPGAFGGSMEWHGYPTRPQVSLNQPSNTLPLSAHNTSTPYYSGTPSNNGSPLPHVYSGGTVFGGVQPPQPTAPFSTNAAVPGVNPMGHHPTPGSGYITHSTDYQRFYQNNSQPPPPPSLQRRQSPPGQNNSGNSTNQHYHTGPQ